jgi:hypothetical protein
VLQALPTPSKVWEELTMDFITHLPNSFGHTVIYVVCARLTKYAHFIALPTKVSAIDLAGRFSVEICRLHGILKSIITDQDPLFLSAFLERIVQSPSHHIKIYHSLPPKN